MNIEKQKEYTVLAINAAFLGGQEILKVYNQNFDVEIKSDGSPLTIADKNANDVICRNLEKLDFPILSEEGKSITYDERKDWLNYWIVDPLDGTKEFVKRNGDFTVNIALMNMKEPLCGIIYVPVTDQMYFGGQVLGSYRIDNYTKNQSNSFKQLVQSAEKLPSKTTEKYTIVASRSHPSRETQEYIEKLEKKYGSVEIVSRGSSLKICMIAEGLANEYPRFAPTMEWDIAAGHGIALGAGKDIIDVNTSSKMLYNRKNLLNNWFIVS